LYLLVDRQPHYVDAIGAPCQAGSHNRSQTNIGMIIIPRTLTTNFKLPFLPRLKPGYRVPSTFRKDGHESQYMVVLSTPLPSRSRKVPKVFHLADKVIGQPHSSSHSLYLLLEILVE
jgi:hypothetical protein